MNNALKIVAAVMVLGLAVASAYAERETEIAIDQVPKVVLDAAEKAVPGIKLTEAEYTTKGEGRVYELEGTAGGKEYELHITAEGKVLDSDEADD
jgi:hypothetical protein